jgi:hypothetical protein
MSSTNTLGSVMSKYDDLKYWVKVEARVPHRCRKCGATVNKGESYYKEKFDFVKPPPGFVLAELCQSCGEDITKRSK